MGHNAKKKHYEQRYSEVIQKVEEVILGNFTNINCYQCEHRDGIGGCNECDKKNLYWQVSKKWATKVANEIVIQISDYIQDVDDE